MMTVRAPVRDGLLEALGRSVGAGTVEYAAEPLPLTGGFWAELCSFRLEQSPPGWPSELVARVMPDAATAAKETAFQAGVAEQGYRTPAVLAAGGADDGIDGNAWLVMPLAAGRPLLSGLDGVGALIRLPSLARRLPVALAQVMASLHRLDPAPIRERLTPGGGPVPGIGPMLEHLRASSTALDRLDLVAAIDRLQEDRPSPGTEVVCHGDLHPFNVLVDDGGATTVLDWSAALLAPADYDVAFTSLVLAQPPLVAPTPLRPVVRAAGAALSRRFLRQYERASGRAVDRRSLDWHHGLICVRALVEVAGWSASGTLADRRGHPWVIAADAFVDRLHALTGVRVSSH